jgi:dual specificity MAP kinase phosphatase
VPWLPASEQDGYECYRLDILDLESQDLKPHLEDAVEDIDSALRRGRNVLVHCQQVSVVSALTFHLLPTAFVVVPRL